MAARGRSQVKPVDGQVGSPAGDPPWAMVGQFRGVVTSAEYDMRNGGRLVRLRTEAADNEQVEQALARPGVELRVTVERVEWPELVPQEASSSDGVWDALNKQRADDE